LFPKNDDNATSLLLLQAMANSEDNIKFDIHLREIISGPNSVELDFISNKPSIEILSHAVGAS
jgi:hypothetical protein